MLRQRHRLLVLLLSLFALGLAAGQFMTTRAARQRTPRIQTERRDTGYDITLGKGYRFDRGGWTYVHLEGSPHDMGVQHGYLMAQEIADFYGVVRLEMTS